MLASILQPVVRPEGAARAAGRYAVALPSRPPMPVDAVLSGTETIVRDAVAVTITVAAAGTLCRARDGADASPHPPPTITLGATRVVDAASGLLHEERDFVTVTIQTETVPSRVTVETLTQVSPPSQ